ncbi:MAG: hypothetical protein ACK6CT_13475 [Planctomycetia bacterium]
MHSPPTLPPQRPGRQSRTAPVCSIDPDEEDDIGDEEDLAVSQPLADEESNFDDFDDDFDDDFEEDENDPDWDHPDEGDEEPPPGKGSGGKK